MAVVISRNDAGETQAIAEMAGQGFVAAAKEYAPGSTEPHRHDYDVCLLILEGEFRLLEADKGLVHRCTPGDQVMVDAGTLHAEEHGVLKMVVGRRQ